LLTNIFKAMHVRIGSLSIPIKFKYEDEHKFTGSIFQGISNDFSESDIKGKDVIVVGCGA